MAVHASTSKFAISVSLGAEMVFVESSSSSLRWYPQIFLRPTRSPITHGHLVLRDPDLGWGETTRRETVHACLAFLNVVLCFIGKRIRR